MSCYITAALIEAREDCEGAGAGRQEELHLEQEQLVEGYADCELKGNGEAEEPCQLNQEPGSITQILGQRGDQRWAVGERKGKVEVDHCFTESRAQRTPSREQKAEQVSEHAGARMEGPSVSALTVASEGGGPCEPY